MAEEHLPDPPPAVGDEQPAVPLPSEDEALYYPPDRRSWVRRHPWGIAAAASGGIMVLAYAADVLGVAPSLVDALLNAGALGLVVVFALWILTRMTFI